MPAGVHPPAGVLRFRPHALLNQRAAGHFVPGDSQCGAARGSPHPEPDKPVRVKHDSVVDAHLGPGQEIDGVGRET